MDELMVGPVDGLKVDHIDELMVGPGDELKVDPMDEPMAKSCRGLVCTKRAALPS